MNSCASIRRPLKYAATARDRKRCKSASATCLLTEVEPAGSYAVKLVFDDGHDSGLYTWEYLYELGKYQDAMWHEYLTKMEEAGASRDN